MDAKELRSLALPELKERLNTEEREFFSLKFKKETNQLKQTHLLRTKKRDIARIKTIVSNLYPRVCKKKQEMQTE